jgi:membrane-associated phospholipid phosphatase
MRPEPPPAYRGAAWQADADEVVRVTEGLTDEQVRIARFWADGSGSETPAGHWARIALELIARDGLGIERAAEVLAFLSMAQADAFIACWDAKYAYWTGRPIALIKGFASTIITPNFPSYPSGHSVQSAASAVVLAYFFPEDADVLLARADEAGLSRLYGGIHYRVDIEVGATMGQRIGTLATERAAEIGAGI